MIRPLDDGRSIEPGFERVRSERLEPRDQTADLASSAPTKRPRRRLRLVILSLLIGLLLAAVIAPPVLKVVIRRQLAGILAENLIGELRIGTISFSWPWTIDVSDASFITKAPGGDSIEMFRVPRLTLQLARSPLGKGPVWVQSATIDRPSIHLILTKDGIVGVRPTPPSDKPLPKLSELAVIQHFASSGGEFILDDQTDATSLPMEFSKVELSLDHPGSAVAPYAFTISADGAADGKIRSKGTADFDAYSLDVESCNATLVAGGPARQKSALPAIAQQPLRSLDVVGELAIHASGSVPLLHAQNTRVKGTIDLKNGQLSIGERPARLENVTALISADAPTDILHQNLRIVALSAAAGDASVHLENAPASLDLANGFWTAHLPAMHLATGSNRLTLPENLRELLAQWNVHGTVELEVDASGPLASADAKLYHADLHLKPNDLTIQPPTMKSPLDRFADTTISLEKGSVILKQFRANCGDDFVFIREAHLNLTELPRKFSIEQAGGAITFGAKHGGYPPEIAEYIDRYDPSGVYFFTGNFSTESVNDKTKLDYDIQLQTRRGKVSLIDRRIPVYNVVSQLRLTPSAIGINSFEADAVGGRLSGSGIIDTGKTPAYNLQLSGTGLDLREVAVRMGTPGHPPALISGRAQLKVQCNGTIPLFGSVLDQIKGSGTFEIHQAGLFEVPVLKEIAAKVNSPQAGVVSDAGAQFHVADNKIYVDRALISAPALGVEGTGTVGFDGTVDFHKVTALVGGDWQQNAGGDTPAAQVVGGIQKALNNVTRIIWYDVDVGGTINQPLVHATMAPFLTRPVMHLKELIH
ncbi:MAG TPA: AsmA-like C-terminal region-containing protein [Humisphaera sp.]|jgi:uncharacterized protein involved in outer membrane biogenesis|nr:AsmA-like C-terminal region-containing protein [Humisphaera sp.]